MKVDTPATDAVSAAAVAGLCKPLLRALSRLIALHERLLTHTAKQREALLVNDSALLAQLLDSIEETVAQVQMAEEERIAATTALADHFGLDAKALTVQELLAVLSGWDVAAMIEATDKLRGLITQLAASNERNRLLTEQSIKITQHTLDTVAGVIRTDTYEAQGNTRKSAKQARTLHMFDVQA